jgi:hypothetical protein
VLKGRGIGWQHCNTAEVESLTHIGIDVESAYPMKAIPAESPKCEPAVAYPPLVR